MASLFDAGLMQTTLDAYLRLHPTRPPLAGPVPTVPGSLVFIDLDPPGDAERADSIAYLTKRIVGAPPGFFLQASSILLRWPDAGATDVDLVAQAHAISELVSARSARDVRVGFVVFPLDEKPSIVWSSGGPDPQRDRKLLARARRVELYTLLDQGGGIWRPDGYHYSLPSGEHSSTFVRLADAFKRPRDPMALATWLHHDIRNGLAIVTDTPTLLPLVSAIELVAGRQGLPGPSVVMLTDYPSNHFEVEHAVADVAGADHVLGLVSVSSTGAVARRIATALDRSHQNYSLETLISRGSPAAEEVHNERVRVRRPWLSVEDHGGLFSSADVCRLCRNADRAHVVFIDPRSFEPMVLPRPDLLTPAVRRATDWRNLWQYYDRTLGVGVHGQPHSTTREFRSNRPRLAVRCYPHWLLAESRYEDLPGDPKTGRAMYAQFLEDVTARVAKIASEITRAERAAEADPAFVSDKIDCIITTAEDADSAGFAEFIRAVINGFGVSEEPALLTAHRPYAEMGDLVEEVKGRSNVLVVTLGAITGTTMQQVLLGIHTILPAVTKAQQPQVAGLVLHARPEDEREWEVLGNAYTRLHAIWRTPLSLGSPFDDEDALLGVFAPEPADKPAKSFYDLRLSFLNESDPDWGTRIEAEDSETDPWAVFWGMPLGSKSRRSSKDTPRLRPGSLYGHRLRACSTFAAAGGAIQVARLANRPKSAPVLQQFEMPAILRSYFDPPIVASILRWIEPHEAWWGDRPSDAANVLAETFARADVDDVKVLLPECLLAAALGKVPASGCGWLEALASHVVWCWEQGVEIAAGASPWTDEEIGPVQLGLALVRRDHSGAGSHFQRAGDCLSRAAALLSRWQGDPDAARSLATAHLLRAVEAFVDSAKEPAGAQVALQDNEPDGDNGGTT